MLYTTGMTKTNLSEGSENEPARLARARALRSFALSGWLALCAAVYVIAVNLVRHHPDWGAGWRATVMLTPILPGLLALRTGLRLLREMDELQRRIQLEGWFFAAIGTVIVSTVINVCNAQGLEVRWMAQGLQVGGAYLTMFCLWGIGTMIANLRYR